MKYKVLKCGWTAQAINPYSYLSEQLNDYGNLEMCINPDWADFNDVNPILPLIRQHDEGIEVNGDLVWQYQSNLPDRDNLNQWFIVDNYMYAIMYKNTIYNTRRACKPVTEYNKEEKPELESREVSFSRGKQKVTIGDYFEWHGIDNPVYQVVSFEDGKNIYSPSGLGGTFGISVINIKSGIVEEWCADSVASGIFTTVNASPLPIASASIETSVWQAAQDYCRSIGASVTGPTFSAYMASYNTWGKQTQTTQQPLIELLEKRITKLIEMQERSAVKYKACFGDKNPGGEQIYEYFALQLKELLKP